MYLEYLYYEFKEAIPSMVCKKIISAGSKNIKGKYKSTEIKEAETGHGGKAQKGGHRKSEVAWIQEQWLFNLILPFIDEANQKAGWFYQWDQCEAVQFTQYTVGDYYRWHMDGQSDRDGAYRKKDPAGKKTPKNWIGKVRKLSATISLNDNYEGGDFELMSDSFYDRESDGMKREIRKPKIKEIGSIIVFPSYLHHRITEVTKGIRHSLVVWCLGEPFV